MRRSLRIGGSSSVQWRKVGRSWRLRMCFRRLLCVRIEIDQLQCVNCWVIIHCLSVSCTTINHSRCALVIWSSLQLTSKQWIITQQFTVGADLFLKQRRIDGDSTPWRHGDVDVTLFYPAGTWSQINVTSMSIATSHRRWCVPARNSYCAFLHHNNWAVTWDFQQCGMCNQQSLRSACAYAQSDQSLYWSLEYSMSGKLLTEHNLEFLSIKGGCTGSSESTLVKLPHFWKSHVAAHIMLIWFHCFPVMKHCIPFGKVRHNLRIESWLGCM